MSGLDTTRTLSAFGVTVEVTTMKNGVWTATLSFGKGFGFTASSTTTNTEVLVDTPLPK